MNKPFLSLRLKMAILMNQRGSRYTDCYPLDEFNLFALQYLLFVYLGWTYRCMNPEYKNEIEPFHTFHDWRQPSPSFNAIIVKCINKYVMQIEINLRLSIA
ncbi:MAG: hypothetical protein EXX96DRAFT_543183 [Benjaminiella poitrasii]|nr:MAG: hypothetical protein EXX96DRAFT_543183 [Benjaminiella poitrasii]